jgi:hypothetical protein
MADDKRNRGDDQPGGTNKPDQDRQPGRSDRRSRTSEPSGGSGGSGRMSDEEEQE